MPSVMAAWYVSLFLVTRNLRPTLMIRNMRSSQNINICCGPAEPVPLTLDLARQNEIQLHELSKGFDDMAIVKKMKEIVPEFKSQNSKYQELDK